MLTARGDLQVNAERKAGEFATCWPSAERTGLVVEARVGSSAELRGNWWRARLPGGLSGVLAQGTLFPKRIFPGCHVVCCMCAERPKYLLSQRAELKNETSSARRPRVSSMCRATSNCQETHALSLMLWSPLRGNNTSPIALSSVTRKSRSTGKPKFTKNKSPRRANDTTENATDPSSDRERRL